MKWFEQPFLRQEHFDDKITMNDGKRFWAFSKEAHLKYIVVESNVRAMCRMFHHIYISCISMNSCDESRMNVFPNFGIQIRTQIKLYLILLLRGQSRHSASDSTYIY